MYLKSITWNLIASRKWISCISLIAWTYRAMIDDLAASVLSASSWTRILAFVSETSLREWTVGTDYAFRSAIRRRTRLSRLTRTYSHIIQNFTNTVWSAGRWIAFVHSRYIFRSGSAKREWVSCCTDDTSAHWNVVVYVAFCVLPTRSRARIFTFAIEACFVRRTIRIGGTFRSTWNVWISRKFW